MNAMRFGIDVMRGVVTKSSLYSRFGVKKIALNHSITATSFIDRPDYGTFFNRVAARPVS